MEVDYEMQASVNYYSYSWFDPKTRRIVLLAMNPDCSDFVFITKNPKTYSTIIRTAGVGRNGNLATQATVLVNQDASLYSFILSGYSGTTPVSSPAIYIYNARTGVVLVKELQSLGALTINLRAMYYNESDNTVTVLITSYLTASPYTHTLRAYSFNLTGDETNCTSFHGVELSTGTNFGSSVFSSKATTNYRYFGIIPRQNADNFGRSIYVYDLVEKAVASYTITNTYILSYRDIAITDAGFIVPTFTSSSSLSALLQKITFTGTVSSANIGQWASTSGLSMSRTSGSYGIELVNTNGTNQAGLLFNASAMTSSSLTLVKAETGVNDTCPYGQILTQISYFLMMKYGATGTYRRYANLFAYNSDTPTVLDLSNNSNYTSSLVGMPLAFIME